MPDLQFRAMRSADLPAVFALQCRAHPVDYHEPLEALASRLVAGPEHCFVAERGEVLAGYVFAHPWAGEPPALHASLKPRAVADHVFLHDLAVSPGFQGMSVGLRLHAAVQVQAVASGFDRMRLVAVGTAETFWQRLGFVAEHAQHLHASYGESVQMQHMLLTQALPADARSKAGYA